MATRRVFREAVRAHPLFTCCRPHLALLPLTLFLLYLTVTAEIDDVLSIDYSLVEAPRATAQMLDVMFKVRV